MGRPGCQTVAGPFLGQLGVASWDARKRPGGPRNRSEIQEHIFRILVQDILSDNV